MRQFTGRLALCLALASVATAAAQTPRFPRLRDAIGKAAAAVDRPAADGAPAPADPTAGYLGVIADDPGDGAVGVLVVDVTPGSPAEKAGLLSGSHITAANGKSLTSIDDFADALAGAKVGDRINFTVDANGQSKRVDVVLGRRPADAAGSPTPAASPDLMIEPGVPSGAPDSPGGELPADDAGEGPGFANPTGGAGVGADRPTLGVGVAELTEEARTQYGLTTVRRGALISSVRPGGPADRAGVPIGAAVVQMDSARIDNADQLIEAIRDARPGQEVELKYYQGDKLTRKSIRLASAGPLATGTPPRPGRLNLGAPTGGDGSLMRTVERAIGNVTGGAIAGGAAAAPADVAAMQREIANLREQVQTLQDRLRQLEPQLPDDGGPREAPANPLPAPEEPAPTIDGPTLSPPALELPRP